MKKSSSIVFMLAFTLAVVPVAAEEKVDLIVLLDSSKSMFQYYNQVVDYVLTETVRDYLRFGDSFHLISFSDTAQLEIAQELKTETDLKSVIARLYLLYPLGRNTDLVTALKNVYQYVDQLPSKNTKHIILITDGMHSPASGTPYALLDVSEVRKEIDSAAVKIRERGWTMRIVRVPFTADTSGTNEVAGTNGIAGDSTIADSQTIEAAPSSPGSGDYLADVAAAVGQDIQTFDPENRSASVEAGVDIHRIIFPSNLGTQNYSFNIQVTISNTSELLIPLELSGLLLENGTDILTKKVKSELPPRESASLSLNVRLPETMPAGQVKLLLEPRFQSGFRVSPARSEVTLMLEKSTLLVFFKNTVGWVLLLLIFLITCVLIFFVISYTRRAHRKTAEPIVGAILDSATMADKTEPSTHKRQYILDEASNQKHTIPDQILIHKNIISRPGVAHVATAMATWKTPGFGRKQLPLRSESEKPRPVAGRAPMHFEPRISRPGTVRLTMHVQDQNPNIGMRNIRTLHAGGRASVGGGKSSFLIFLYPVPKVLAHLYFDGFDATLVPQNPKYFPDYDSPIESCIGQDIRLFTAKGKELIIRFERYVPPLDKINKLLHCIETPGVPIIKTDLLTEQMQPPDQV